MGVVVGLVDGVRDVSAVLATDGGALVETVRSPRRPDVTVDDNELEGGGMPVVPPTGPGA